MSILEHLDLRRRLPVADRRRTIRKRAGLSMREIAEAIGVSTAAVGQWERGERDPQGRNLEAYVKLLETIQAHTGTRRDV